MGFYDSPVNPGLKLELIKRVLLGIASSSAARAVFRDIHLSVERIRQELERTPDSETMEGARYPGINLPDNALTMVGLKRLDDLHRHLDRIREAGIEGDFIETGVWRGGVCIFIQLYNLLYGLNRTVFVADSFRGLPPPDEKYPQDEGDTHHLQTVLAVSKEQVADNFKKFKALDRNVVFLEGWFADTLGDQRIGKLALLRFDGDMYGSTIDVLSALYPKVVMGGTVIIDDYGLENCKKATDDFRAANCISQPLVSVDRWCSYWIK